MAPVWVPRFGLDKKSHLKRSQIWRPEDELFEYFLCSTKTAIFQNMTVISFLYNFILILFKKSVLLPGFVKLSLRMKLERGIIYPEGGHERIFTLKIDLGGPNRRESGQQYLCKLEIVFYEYRAV